LSQKNTRTSEGSIEALDITSKKKEIQNKWKLKVDENSEMTKITVLNDPGVGKAIRQVIFLHVCERRRHREMGEFSSLIKKNRIHLQYIKNPFSDD
jgi:hypothetical protein